MKQTTVVTEILNHCNKLLSEDCEIDTQGLVHWIEDTLLKKEQEQIETAFGEGILSVNITGKQYYKNTYEKEN